MVRELCLKYERIDPVKDLIPVRPVVHYMMGGVQTDINGATPIEGLFAAGETACVTSTARTGLGPTRWRSVWSSVPERARPLRSTPPARSRHHP